MTEGLSSEGKNTVILSRSHVLSAPLCLNLSSGGKQACPVCLGRLSGELNEDLPLREPGTCEGLLPLSLLDASQIPKSGADCPGSLPGGGGHQGQDLKEKSALAS